MPEQTVSLAIDGYQVTINKSSTGIVFRDWQREALGKSISNITVVVVVPTGSGKTLCYTSLPLVHYALSQKIGRAYC